VHALSNHNNNSFNDTSLFVLFNFITARRQVRTIPVAKGKGAMGKAGEGWWLSMAGEGGHSE